MIVKNNKAYYNLLEKIKSIEYIDKCETVSIEGVSKYYEVPKKTIETIISRNKDEFKEDGMITLRGEKLKNYRTNININKTLISPKARFFTIINAKTMINIGFKLFESDIAEKVKELILEMDKEIYYSFINSSKHIIKKYEKEISFLLNSVLGKYNEIKKQVDCGMYKIDFVINDYLAIECDEEGHTDRNKIYETERENYIKENGYHIIRYDTRTNNALGFIGEVVQNLNKQYMIN